VILLCHTSNPGAADLQDLDVGGKPLYQHVAQIIARDWNTNGNCALVTGATWPEQLAEVRAWSATCRCWYPWHRRAGRRRRSGACARPHRQRHRPADQLVARDSLRRHIFRSAPRFPLATTATSLPATC
jgi:hypothetical protein